MGKVGHRVALALLAGVAISCGSDDSGDTLNVDDATKDGGAVDGGPICGLETDAQLCARLGKSCGTASGIDLCGNNRESVACGLCPSSPTECIFTGDPTGASDSTDALVDAIQCSVDNDFAVVRIPKGKFIIKKKVAVPSGVPISGEADASFGVNGPIPYDSLPQLVFDGVTDDGLELAARSSVRGIQVTGGLQSANKALLRVAGEAVTISNVKITGGQWGIRSEAAIDAKDLFITNVFMVIPQGGIAIGKATGASRIENVHVWNPTADTPPFPAFLFTFTEKLTTSLLSAFKYPFAVQVANATVDFAGFEGDLCNDGIASLGASNVHIAGGTLFSHFTSVIVDGTSNVVVTGSHIATNGQPSIWVKSAGASLALTGNTILRESNGFTAPAVRVDAAKNLSIVGNSIAAYGIGIYFTGPPKAGAVFGNAIQVLDAASTGWFPAGVGATTFTGNSTNRVPL